MPGGFEVPHTERTEVLVWPSASLQAIGAPETVVEQQPEEKLTLGRRPLLPDNDWSLRTNLALEVDLVRGAGCVGAALGQQPGDGVGSIRTQGPGSTSTA
jgi:hypothetical protein